MQNLTEQLALNAMWRKAGRTNCTYFMDSGCSTTIINNVSVLHDIHNIPPVIIDGLTGSRTLTQGGTLQIELLDFNGDPYILVIPDVLYDPDVQVNLVSASQLTDLGFGIMLTKDPNTTALVLPAEQQNATWGLPLQRVNNVYFLCENDAHSPPPAPAYQAARFNRLTLEELMHLRFNHTPVEKLVKLNCQVRGLPRPLRHTKHTHLPCGTCSQAKSVKSPFQDASQNDDRDLWHWDMLDMGENHKTLNGNRYATFFVIRKTRFVMLFLHASKSAGTVLSLMHRARAKAGYWPAYMRSDGAPEYHSPQINALFEKEHIERETSNAFQQEQNAAAETFVGTVGAETYNPVMNTPKRLPLRPGLTP